MGIGVHPTKMHVRPRVVFEKRHAIAMTQPQDAALLAALESQCRQLDEVLSRLERARVVHVPAAASYWRGTARHAYDAALGSVVCAAELGQVVLREARDHLVWATMEVRERG